jgi:hypothetical protein
MLSKTGFNDRLRCVGMKVFRRVEERCTFQGLLMNVTHPGRAVEAQSSHTHTRMDPVLSLVLLTPLKWSGESAHVRRNCFSAGLALIIARLRCKRLAWYRRSGCAASVINRQALHRSRRMPQAKRSAGCLDLHSDSYPCSFDCPSSRTGTTRHVRGAYLCRRRHHLCRD